MSHSVHFDEPDDVPEIPNVEDVVINLNTDEEQIIEPLTKQTDVFSSITSLPSPRAIQKSIFTKDQEDLEPVVSIEELSQCFAGKQPLPKITDGRDPAEICGNYQDNDLYDWIMAIAIPNPNTPVGTKFKQIDVFTARRIFRRCFKGEEVVEQGISRQQSQFKLEEKAFLKVFLKLPSVPNTNRRRFVKFFNGGEEHRPVHDPYVPYNFLGLIRNVIYTKIYLHCGLPVRCCLSEDEANVIVTVSCTPKDLEREADRSNFLSELETRVVDAESLEPCTEKTFYPLTQYYLKICKSAPDVEVLSAVQHIFDKFKSESEELREKYAIEMNMYENLISAAKKLIKQKGMEETKNTIKTEEDEVIDNEDDEEENNKSSPLPKIGKNLLKVLPKKGSMKSASGILPTSKSGIRSLFGISEFHEHFDLTKNENEVRSAFLRYLELRAELGLSTHPNQVLDLVNAEYDKSGEAVKKNFFGKRKLRLLNNYWDALKVPPIAVFKEFEAGLPSYIWKTYPSRPRGGDTMLSCYWPFIGRAKLIRLILNRQLDVNRLMTNKLLTGIFPIETREKLLKVNSTEKSFIAQAWQVPEEASIFTKFFSVVRCGNNPPAEWIRRYYGEHLSMYFSFLDTLMRWLVFPAIFGVPVFAIQRVYWKQSEINTPGRATMDFLYSIVIVCWATVVLEAWKRRQALLASLWGTAGVESNAPVRPQFTGQPRRSPIDYADNDMYFPSRTRLYRTFISFTAIFAMALVMIGLTVSIAVLRTNWVKNDWPGSSLANLVTAGMTSIQIFIFQFIGKKMSRQFNGWENYRTDIDFIDALIYKTSIFEFINRSNAYFYIAFVKAPLEGCIVLNDDGKQELQEWNGQMCLYELTTQIMIILLLNASRNVGELCLPIILHKWNTRHQKPPKHIAVNGDTGEARLSHFCQLSLEKPPYGDEEVDGTFEDYQELTTLFGDMILFSVAFPLAPLVGVLLTGLEARIDGFKMFHIVRRPMPKSVEDIGSWYTVFQVYSWVSVFTNSAILVWTFEIFENSDLPPYVFFSLICIFLISFKLIIAYLVPDISTGLSIARIHNEWVGNRASVQDIDIERTVLPIEYLDLSIDDANSGKLRAPEDFGVTRRTTLKYADRFNRITSKGGQMRKRFFQL